jgi:hypothetical protein
MARHPKAYLQLVSLLEQVGETDACIDWPHKKDKDGYGWCTKDGEKRAHRVAFSLENGRKLKADEKVLHRCDRPCCINPKHLWVGTQRDNMLDMRAKGRESQVMPPSTAGDLHGKALISSADVLRIRALWAQNVSQTQIAAMLGVARTTIGDVVRRVTWNHIA